MAEGLQRTLLVGKVQNPGAFEAFVNIYKIIIVLVPAGSHLCCRCPHTHPHECADASIKRAPQQMALILLGISSRPSFLFPKFCQHILPSTLHEYRMFSESVNAAGRINIWTETIPMPF